MPEVPGAAEALDRVDTLAGKCTGRATAPGTRTDQKRMAAVAEEEGDGESAEAEADGDVGGRTLPGHSYGVETKAAVRKLSRLTEEGEEGERCGRREVQGEEEQTRKRRRASGAGCGSNRCHSGRRPRRAHHRRRRCNTVWTLCSDKHNVQTTMMVVRGREAVEGDASGWEETEL